MNIWYLVLAVLMILPVPALVKNNRVPTNLGYEDGRLAELPASPNAVSSQTSDPERYVEPLPYLGNRKESRQRIISAARLYGNARIVREEDGYLHIVFSTAFMRFKDDAEFLFDDRDGIIHFRSESRLGYSDMGLNRERYEVLRGLYLNDAEQ
jgi:uncharacterized protein (DUF1499 family)